MSPGSCSQAGDGGPPSAGRRASDHADPVRRERSAAGHACNEYSVEMSRSGSEIDFGPGVHVDRDRPCSPKVMESEQSYLKALLGVETFSPRVRPYDPDR